MTAAAPFPRSWSLCRLAVLAAILVTLAFSALRMDVTRLFTQADKAKVQTAETQTKMLKGALETMRLDIGRFPTEQEGLRLLVERPGDERTAARWSGPYLDEGLPADPWGNPYQYSPAPSANYALTLYSPGADGKPGGEGYDADIGYLPRQ